MPTPKPDLRASFNLPFAEQSEFLRQKLDLPTLRWDDIRHEAHNRSFVVAGATKADLLADLHAAVQKAVDQGTGLEEFRKDFWKIVGERGWHGWTGEGTKAGEAWRTKVIWETNLRTSYMAGRYAQLTDPGLLKIAPYWRYIHSESVLHPRPDHLAWNGLVLRHDHPFWQTHFPPNGWGCACRVVSEMAPKEGDPTTPPEGWNAINPKTGAPQGIDKGWAYTPGKSAAEELRSIVEQKAKNLPAPLAEGLKKDFSLLYADNGAEKPPTLAFESQKTSKAAAEWAVRNNLADFANYGKIKPEVANALNQSLFEHLQQFPELREKLEFIGSAQKRNTISFEKRREFVIDLCIGKGLSREEAEKIAAKTVKKMGITYITCFSIVIGLN